MTNGQSLLIVGAGGFIGGHIAAQALQRGYDTWVAVRASTSRRWLQDPRLHVVVLDYDADAATLARALADAAPSPAGWTHVIYNLGATKCANFADYDRINYGYLRRTVQALLQAGLAPSGRFLYMSSLSALGLGDERGYAPLGPDTVPAPNTRYGTSKIKAETFLQTIPTDRLRWTVFRPTGVYGPHERDYLMMIRAIDRHVDFGVGFRRQMLTFIYVDDLVRAMMMALEADATVGRKYIIAESRGYSQKEFRRMAARALGRHVVLPVRVPLWAAWAACAVAQKAAALRGRPSTLNLDKYRILRQRNWLADTTAAARDFGFTAQVSLPEGIRRTVQAYRQSMRQLPQ